MRFGWRSWAGALTTQSPDGDSGHGDMECHLAGGGKPELMWEVERYRLEIVGPTSTHSLGSGTELRGGKPKKEPHRTWLVRGTPEAADRYQQAKHAAIRAVAEAKAQVWEKFGEAMEEDCLEGILATHPAPQEGEAILNQYCLRWRWGAVDLNWGYCWAVEGILQGFPQSH